MKRFIILSTSLLLYCVQTYAKPKVNAEILSEMGSYEIQSKSSSEFNYSLEAIIYNKDGLDSFLFGVFYNSDQKVKDISLEVGPPSAKKLTKYKQKDFTDQSYVDGYSLFVDGRVLYKNYNTRSFPVKVKFSYTLSSAYLFTIPSWQVVDDENIKVDYSAFTLKSPKEIFPRFKVVNDSISPQISTNGDDKILNWNHRDLPVYEFEPFGPSFSHWTPIIRFSTSEFEYEGYRGSMNSWNAFGKWCYDLNRGRGDISLALREKLRALVKGAKSREDSVARIYHYMQAHERYVSVQLGIGSFQPIEAMEVEKNGYGDCKGLVNFTKSLLNAVGIPAYYCLAEAGNNPEKIPDDFVSQYFNHVILAVPNQQDTIWLECTSQVVPAGYTGDFTGNRKVLVVSSKGGTLVKTRHYSPDENKVKRNMEVWVDKAGNAKIALNITQEGVEYESSGFLGQLQATAKDQREWFHKYYLNFPFEIDSLKLENKPSAHPMARISAAGTYNGFAKSIGSYHLIPARLLDLPINGWLNKNHYSQDLRNVFGMELEDSVTFHVPYEVHQEDFNEPEIATSDIGSFAVKYKWIDAHTFQVITHYREEEGEWHGKEKMKAIYAYFKTIEKKGYQKLLIK